MINNKIGLGTAAIGRPSYINIRKDKNTSPFSYEVFRQQGIQTLEAAYKQGIRFFDTAPGYGIAEQMLIDWLRKKGKIDVETATKWGYTYVANFNPDAKQHEVKEHSLEKLNEQWQKSKALLSHLKIYQIHSATLKTGVLANERVLNRLAELKEEHELIIGVTTTGANQLEVLKKAMDINVNGKELFESFQVTYNIFDQSLASIAFKISSQNKFLVIKEGLANGRIFPNEKYPNYHKAYELLNSLAQKYNVGPDAIALRFCIDSIPVYKVLSGAANEQHLAENLKANNFKLEEQDVESLKELAVNPIQYWNERKLLAWN